MAEELVFPRLVYRGEPDVLGTGLVGETKRVEDQAGLDEAKKDGWRLTREDATHQARVAPGKIRVPAQTIQTGASAGELVDENRDAAAGGPAVEQAEADAHPDPAARRAPKRNATKK